MGSGGVEWGVRGWEGGGCDGEWVVTGLTGDGFGRELLMDIGTRGKRHLAWYLTCLVLSGNAGLQDRRLNCLHAPHVGGRFVFLN